MSLWLIVLLIGFIFLITYDPRKGTIHKRLMEQRKETFVKTEEDPLRWKPTTGMYDKVGAIFSV